MAKKESHTKSFEESLKGAQRMKKFEKFTNKFFHRADILGQFCFGLSVSLLFSFLANGGSLANKIIFIGASYYGLVITLRSVLRFWNHITTPKRFDHEGE